jgi:enoyl-CoA hydratase
MTQDVLFTQEKQVGFITLNRPQALNALTLPMINAMQQQLERWCDDPQVHVIVIQAAPGKAFCAGGDVRWLYDAGKRHDPQQMQFFEQEYRLNHFIHQLTKPYIAFMDGITMGGGVGISIHGSHRIASERYVFAMPETSIGFFPDIGASYHLSQSPHHTGIYLGLTGNKANASDALNMGLIDYCIPAERFPNVITSLMSGDFKEDAHARLSELMQSFALPKTYGAIQAETASIDACFRQTEIEVILTKLREGGQDWHTETLQILQTKSPLSLKITLAQLRKAKSMSLAECLNMDYCLASHFMQGHDFYEGVRALLIDKDKSPQWQPHSLEQITSTQVSEYFR